MIIDTKNCILQIGISGLPVYPCWNIYIYIYIYRQSVHCPTFYHHLGNSGSNYNYPPARGFQRQMLEDFPWQTLAKSRIWHESHGNHQAVWQSQSLAPASWALGRARATPARETWCPEMVQQKLALGRFGIPFDLNLISSTFTIMGCKNIKAYPCCFTTNDASTGPSGPLVSPSVPRPPTWRERPVVDPTSRLPKPWWWTPRHLSHGSGMSGGPTQHEAANEPTIRFEIDRPALRLNSLTLSAWSVPTLVVWYRDLDWSWMF